MNGDPIKDWAAPEAIKDEQYVVVFDELYHDTEPNGRRVFGPFTDEEEASTFIACGPHGLEEFVEFASVVSLNAPHCP